MNVSRRGFLSSIVLAYTSARTRARKLWSPGEHDVTIIYSQNMRVPFTEKEVASVELERVRAAIPHLFECNDTFFRTTKTGQRVGGRQRRQGGRTNGVGEGRLVEWINLRTPDGY